MRIVITDQYCCIVVVLVDLFRMDIADMMQHNGVMTKLYYDDVDINSAQIYGSTGSSKIPSKGAKQKENKTENQHTPVVVEYILCHIYRIQK